MNRYLYDVIHMLSESGIDSSMKTIIGEIMSAGKNAVTAEQAEMVYRYLNTLADKNDQDALLSLGALYYTGLGSFIPQDYGKAMHYYERASEVSEMKDHWALNNLGYCHFYGRAGEVDYKKAYFYFSLSATYGNPNAMYKLGDMYYYGNYVDKNVDASFYWYSLAKAQKHDTDTDYQGFLAASISLRMGRAFLFGDGTDVDLIQALFELRTAEVLFYKQILNGDEFSRGQLPKAQELIKAAQDELNKQIS